MSDPKAVRFACSRKFSLLTGKLLFRHHYGMMKPKESLRDALQECFPELSTEELDEAEENFRQYVALTVRMYARIQADPESRKRFEALTDPE